MTANAKRKTQNAKRPVLFVSTYTGLGGGETSLLQMVGHLDPACWTPHLLVPAEGPLADRWRAQGWPVHVLRWRPAMPIFVPAVWARFPVVRRMADLLHREGFAAVHADYHAMPLIVPACERQGIPWLWTCHGWWLRPKPWQRSLFRRAGHTFAVSQAAKDGFLGDPPFMPPERVEVRFLGVDVDRFRPGLDGSVVRRELGIDARARVVTILGRFQPVKGHLNFVQMAARLAPAYPDLRFWIVGDNVLDGLAGDRCKRAVYAAVQADPLLRERVAFAGFRSDTERVLAATDVLVCASDFESFGMAHAEAMACGVPVVSTNRGGPAEIVIDGETGLLVPPCDPAALAEAVRRLLDSPALRQSMGQAGRARAERVLAVEHYAARFDAVLKAISRQPSAVSPPLPGG